MHALNYFKMDLRITKGVLRYYLVFPIILLGMFAGESPVIAINYLFFMAIALAAVPFSSENMEKCERFYYILPAKITSMVTGRYLYLFVELGILWVLNIGAMIYMYGNGSLSTIEAATLCVSGIIATLMCFAQYPLYYKVGIEKGRALSYIMYMVPAFIIFGLPALLINSGIATGEGFQQVEHYVVENRVLAGALVIAFTVLMGYCSYNTSRKICERKEL